MILKSNGFFLSKSYSWHYHECPFDTVTHVFMVFNQDRFQNQWLKLAFDRQNQQFLLVDSDVKIFSL